MTPHKLAIVERARKLLNRANDPSSVPAEREMAYAAADRMLARAGLTRADLVQQEAPSYLSAIRPNEYSQDTANGMAKALRKQGWKSMDPRDHGHSNKPKGDK